MNCITIILIIIAIFLYTKLYKCKCYGNKIYWPTYVAGDIITWEDNKYIITNVVVYYRQKQLFYELAKLNEPTTGRTLIPCSTIDKKERKK